MNNIWQLLLQGLVVSTVIILLLFIKRIFLDKLSPRWQYGVWSIFALRCLVPVKPQINLFFPFGIYVDMAKSIAEKKLNSAYCSQYSNLDFKSAFPFVDSAPESITDMLFLVYILGIIGFVCYYAFNYIKLRLLINKGSELSGEERKRVNDAFSNYLIKPKKIITAKGISSAFICGVIKPVLVLPENKETDEKILYHEAEHLNHSDSLQSLFWCFIKVLNWYNPLVHYAVDKILSDMESLCDQRVLEKLRGEERREYGKLLLNEVNEKYARMIGTTSLSNGGKNITKRIEAIVRFKKYPKGMSLVSVLIAFILCTYCFFISGVNASTAETYTPGHTKDRYKAVAMARINKCKTPASAIDTWAKGKAAENGYLLLIVSTEAEQEKLLKETGKNWETPKENGRFNYIYTYRDSFLPYELSSVYAPYGIFNVRETEKDKYTADIGFSIDRDNNPLNEENLGSVFIPIEVYKENDYFVVKEKGERTYSDDPIESAPFNQLLENNEPFLFKARHKGKNGTLNVITTVQYVVSPLSNQTAAMSPSDAVLNFNNNIDKAVYYNAKFSNVYTETHLEYICDEEKIESYNSICIIYSHNTEYQFEEDIEETFSGISGASSSSDGSGYSWSTEYVGKGEEKSIMDSLIDNNSDPYGYMKESGRGLSVAVYVDDKKVDEFKTEVN